MLGVAVFSVVHHGVYIRRIVFAMQEPMLGIATGSWC